MNGYQRISSAMQGVKPDRVPVLLHNFMMAAREMGITMEQYRNSPRLIADCLLASAEKYDVDGILVDLDTATLAGALGVPVDFPVDQTARVHEPLIKSLDQVGELKPVDISSYKYVEIWLEAVRLLRESVGGQIYIRGNCDQAPFSLASMVRTPGDWMMDLMIEPEKCHLLLDYTTEAVKQFIFLMSQAGADMVSNGDSPAGPSMISPVMYREFALPYEQKIAQYSHSLNMPWLLHICGDTTLILEDMKESGMDAVELDYKTDIQKIFSTYSDSIAFLGNLDPSGLLCSGSISDIKSETRKLVALYKDSPRFILNAGCAIPAETPSQNLKAMIDASREL